MSRRAGMALVLLSLVAEVPAAETVHSDGTSIIGNREQPKLLIIVPWKRPPPGRLPVRPYTSRLDEALRPVVREVMRRRIDYEKAVTERPKQTPNQQETQP